MKTIKKTYNHTILDDIVYRLKIIKLRWAGN